MMGNLDGYSMSTMVVALCLLGLYASEFNPLSDNLTAKVVCTSSMLSAIVTKLFTKENTISFSEKTD